MKGKDGKVFAVSRLRMYYIVEVFKVTHLNRVDCGLVFARYRTKLEQRLTYVVHNLFTYKIYIIFNIKLYDRLDHELFLDTRTFVYYCGTIRK